MPHPSWLALGLALVVLLSGCSGPAGGEAGGDGSTVRTPPPPPPVTLVEHSQEPADIPTGANPWMATVDVEAPYGELSVFVHASGVGTYRFQVTDANGTSVYDTGEITSTNEPGSHSAAAIGTKVAAPAGAYEARMDWTGAIAYHVRLVAKVPGHDDGDGGDHDHD